jgi:hypothetical protein
MQEELLFQNPTLRLMAVVLKHTMKGRLYRSPPPRRGALYFSTASPAGTMGPGTTSTPSQAMARWGPLHMDLPRVTGRPSQRPLLLEVP